MIYLKNSGEIPLKVLTMMGVSVKTGDGPIGQFGTGLKYAIAVFLREGVKVDMHIGHNKYEFDTESVDIRGQEFHACRLIGPRDVLELPFAQSMGKNWSEWQAYREIHSNCLDEGGQVSYGEPLKPEDGHTLFVIHQDPDMYEGTFLDPTGDRGRNVLWKNNDIQILEGESEFIYYNGIRAMTLNKPSKFTYNLIRHMSLTEDRNIAHHFIVEKEITNAVGECSDKDLVLSIVTAENKYFEASIDACWDTAEPGEVFTEVVKENTGKVLNNFYSYHKQNEPEEEEIQTKEEQIEQLLDKLSNVCDSFDMDIEHTGNTFVISGGILDDEDE